MATLLYRHLLNLHAYIYCRYVECKNEQDLIPGELNEVSERLGIKSQALTALEVELKIEKGIDTIPWKQLFSKNVRKGSSIGVV